MGSSCPAITGTISCWVLLSAAPGCCGHVGIPVSGPGNNRRQIYCFVDGTDLRIWYPYCRSPRCWPCELLMTVGLAVVVAAWTGSLVAVRAVYVPYVTWVRRLMVCDYWSSDWSALWGQLARWLLRGFVFARLPKLRLFGSAPRMSGRYNR